MALLEKLFGFDHQKHKIKTEVMAGVTTFLTMAYILAVNPSIFANLAGMGMDTNAVFTSTALAAVIGTMIMAIYAKKPFGSLCCSLSPRFAHLSLMLFLPL